jgi:hypothetical protein
MASKISGSAAAVRPMALAYAPPSMLKTPASLQPCSSSPMSARSASVERVVLPAVGLEGGD